MAKRRISEADGLAALRKVLAGDDSGTTVATAVRYLLEELAERAPGNSVEVRVPPFGATQCYPGPRHSRGTPPNVIEMRPDTWIALATGRLEWQAALDDARVVASGARADISAVLPLIR
ncbi:sterol carrier family protein [Leucobacter sp. W1153]|uniref:sterol carrier family protein n=1 Tax=unclassified Leucobacter TaxID=2621730 RepID=UPI003F3E228D